MKPLFSLCILLLSSFISQAQTVTLLSDDPKDLELFYTTGNHDIASDSYRLLLKNLPDIKVELEIAPTARIDALLKEDRTMCAVNRIKTPERDLYNIYSYPVHLYPSHRLYYFKNKTPLTDDLLTEEHDLISIQKLITKYPSATIGIESGRSYGKALDKQLSKIKEKNILRRAGSDAYQSMIALFQRQRVDLLITYPTVFKEYTTGQNDNIGSVSIAKHPLFIAGHIACSNTAYSQEIIKQINRALLDLYPSDEYLSMHLHHVPNTEQSLLTRRISDLFLKYKLLSKSDFK